MTRTNSKVDGSLRELSSVLARLGEEDLVQVFNALLTPREREKIALRWKLVCLLEKGLTQRAIAARLGISLCKITRGSHELKHGPESFRNIARQTVRASMARGTVGRKGLKG